MNTSKTAKNPFFAGAWLVRNSAIFGLLAMALLGAMPVWSKTVNLKPGDVWNWDEDKPASGDTINATGGTINFNSSTYVTNTFVLSGEVTVNIANGKNVRLVRTFRKESDAGKMVVSSGIRFGSNNSSVLAFLPANSIEFASTAPENAECVRKSLRASCCSRFAAQRRCCRC